MLFVPSDSISPLEVPMPRDIDRTKQAVEVPGTRRPGQTGVYRNGVWGLKGPDHQPHVRTVCDIFELGLRLSKDKGYLGYRPLISRNPPKYADYYEWYTYAQVDESRRNIGSALHKLFCDGTLGGEGLPTVGLWSQNRPEWQIIDQALHAYQKVGVALYETFGKDAVEFIIQHAYLTVIFVTLNHIPQLLASSSRLPMLRVLVSIDSLEEETSRVLKAWAQNSNVRLYTLNEFEEIGRANRLDPLPARPEDITTICYTSGTTGNPKGVLLTHQSLASSAVSNLHGISFGDRGLCMSYLPLAHIFQRINELNITGLGGAIGYFSGDILRLLEDAQILRPNFFPSVPRVLNRVYLAAMLAGKAPGLKGFLFRSALEAKLKKLHETGDNTHAFWDRLVFRKVQAVLGGRVRVLTCGSAPISPEVMTFLRIAFACDVIEGYGMTENCGTCTRVFTGDPTSSGFVGAPQPCNEVKLVDVPALNYTSQDKPHPRGELCVRGSNVFKAYYKDEKNTRETIDEEGWLHTGDVAEIDSFGRIKIIDRVKNMMKLSQGEYVALEKIENTYAVLPSIAQTFAYGNSLRDYIVGVVVVDPSHLAAIAAEVTGSRVDLDDKEALARVCQDPRVVQAYQHQMNDESKRAGLKGFEAIKKIHLTLEPFIPDNGLATPTLKLKRKEIYNRYKDQIDGLYATRNNGRKALL